MKENLDNKDKEIADLHKKMASMKIQLNEKLTQTSESNLKEFDLDIAQKKISDLEMDMKKITLENLTLKQEAQKLDEGCMKNTTYEKRIEELEEQLKCSKYGIEQVNNFSKNISSLIDSPVIRKEYVMFSFGILRPIVMPFSKKIKLTVCFVS